LKKSGVLFLLLLSAVPCLVQAASVEEGHSASSGAAAFLGKAVNALILFGGLAFLLAKTVRSFLDARTSDIERSIREAAESRANAEKRFKDVRARLDRIEEELRRIREDGDVETARSVGRIRELAGQEADRLKRLTRQEIELGVRGALRELREYAADLAIGSAEERIRKSLNEDRHARLIDRSIDRLGRLQHEEPDAR
jgi:F0F1-type ATP synthase membrane subunit b/b'